MIPNYRFEVSNGREYNSTLVAFMPQIETPSFLFTGRPLRRSKAIGSC